MGLLGGLKVEPYQLLSTVLNKIEENISKKITIDDIAAWVSLSAVHLQRIFKFSFGITLAGYIRSRKLAASLDKLLNSDLNIIDIALEYGFQYEQSYIRAFKQEYGITPKAAKKNSVIVKVVPPLKLFDYNEVSNGVLFGPDVVMVPKLFLTGQLHQISFHDSVELPPKVAKEFWENDRKKIKNVVNPDIYYGLTRIPDFNNGWSYYLPSLQTRDLAHIPKGMHGDTFTSSLCARFHYIGKHHYYDINADMARKMYDAIIAYAHDKNTKYTTMNSSLYFEKIDTSMYDGTYCQLEWFTPLIEKSSL